MLRLRKWQKKFWGKNKMTNLFIFTQNLILNSFKKYQHLSSNEDTNIFLTTHFLFENEREYLASLFPNCIFKSFADFLTDEEMGRIDIESYTSEDIAYKDYLAEIKKRKNSKVADKVDCEYSPDNKYILSDDLGVDLTVWKRRGFKCIKGAYYYKETSKAKLRKCLSDITVLKKMYSVLRGKSNENLVYIPEEISVAYYKGRKYVFVGKMNRIEYRLDIPFETSREECDRLNAGKYEKKDTCTYMTTWHEHGKCQIPDDDRYAVRWAQDGYLPPNYTHKDYFFKPKNVIYYCWDVLGTNLFKNQGLPYEMIPFRKKLYLPLPVFPDKIKNVLIVASGSGDWTALKNRSDDDIMVDAFAQMAKRFPNIHFTYRCHPTWVHPLNVGVNAVNRVHDYFEKLALPNLTLSSNMPLANTDGKFQYSFSRSSLDEDLKKADFVFGEHSISMIDAAFKKIPFCSVNLTNRRNFFIGINELGFPTVSSHDEIAEMIEKSVGEDFKQNYLKAVENYNRMTDED